MAVQIEKFLKKLDQEIQLVRDDKERLAQKRRLKELWERYEGDDKIISSYELKELVARERQQNKLRLMTGIPKLDKIIEGFREGNLIVVSAPAKHGKTTLCQTLTIEFAEQDIASLWFSYEVPMAEFIEKFGDKPPLFYLPRQLRGNTMVWIEERIIEAIAKFDAKVVFIDHLHYIVDMAARNQNMSLQIGTVMRSLKKLALKYNITIFIVAHMKHIKLENVPDLEDIRDSSFIGQEADIVLMMWRMKDKNTCEYLNETNLVVRAHRRTGKTGKILLQHKDNRFFELAQSDYEDF